MWQLIINGPGYFDTAYELPDGETTLGRADENDVILSGDYSVVSGGIMATARVMEYFSISDSEMRALSVGSKLDLSAVGYGVVEVEDIEWVSDTLVYVDYDPCYYENGRWVFYYPSDVPYTYMGESVTLFFPDGYTITDYSSASAVTRYDIADIPSYALSNGSSVKIVNGAVTEATIFFRP